MLRNVITSLNRVSAVERTVKNWYEDLSKHHSEVTYSICGIQIDAGSTRRFSVFLRGGGILPKR